MTKILQWTLFVCFPLGIFFTLNLKPEDISSAHWPVAIVLFFWGWLWVHGLFMKRSDTDTGSYGGYLFIVMRFMCSVGFLWGLFGLLIYKWGGWSGTDFVSGRLYPGFALMWFLIGVTLPAFFGRKTISGSFREGGPTEMSRGMMDSHAAPLTSLKDATPQTSDQSFSDQKG